MRQMEVREQSAWRLRFSTMAATAATPRAAASMPQGATLTLSGGSVTGETVEGGGGGTGAAGTSLSVAGGQGGIGGLAQGGGVYVAGGSLTLNNGVVIATNTVDLFHGGLGGLGGTGTTGGSGGAGGNAAGGGVYANGTNVTMNGKQRSTTMMSMARPAARAATALRPGAVDWLKAAVCSPTAVS